MAGTSFLVFGDQLSSEVPLLESLEGPDHRVVLIEPGHLTDSSRHPLRRAFYRLAMRAFADELRARGVEVDLRGAPTFSEGLRRHREHFRPERVVASRPRGRRAENWCRESGVELLEDPFMLTDYQWFDRWVDRSSRRTLESFYRLQRQRTGYLMDGDQPCGGRWNYDQENRHPLPKGGGEWPDPWSHPLDDVEIRVVAEVDLDHLTPVLSYWPRTRAHALDQLRDALERIIPSFGPFEDAASRSNWHLAHSRLSVALNTGLLHPREVLDGVESYFRAGEIPLASAEGFVRQVLGWREWVAAWHRHRSAEYRASNALGARRPLPQAWENLESHPMACLDAVLSHVREYGWAHHIERLMVLTNAATLAGYDPVAVNDWMARTFLDGAEWVMEANVIGMGLFADGGRTATKPYVSGGNYLDTMTDFCGSCRFSPRERTGESACPLTTLYWQFFVDHDEALARVNRVAPIRRSAATRPDRLEIAERASRARQWVDGVIEDPVDGRGGLGNVAE